MPEPNLTERVALLEQNVRDLEALPARMAGVELQIVQLREEMRGEFSAVRQDIAGLRQEIAGTRHEIIGVRGEFRGELQTTAEALRNGIRGELQTTAEALRNGIRGELLTTAEALRNEIRGELQTTAEALRNGIRGELLTTAEALRKEIREGDEETRREMREGVEALRREMREMNDETLTSHASPARGGLVADCDHARRPAAIQTQAADLAVASALRLSLRAPRAKSRGALCVLGYLCVLC